MDIDVHPRIEKLMQELLASKRFDSLSHLVEYAIMLVQNEIESETPEYLEYVRKAIAEADTEEQRGLAKPWDVREFLESKRKQHEHE